MEISLTCKCGNTLKKTLSKTERESPFIIFCKECYLNHEYHWNKGRPIIALQYYFPDD
ncbi:MAG: hypothetical protein HY619_07040 [Thaumarchaeota archaeon]|nr:hypothetical protein [Nitrososphaerota archaeon]